MEIHDITELAVLMRETGLTRLEYSEGGATLKMERGGADAQTGAPAEPGPPEGRFGTAVKDERYAVISPLVGVFYSSPGADQKEFVSVGDKVNAGDVLCIIESMKIMNEIAAEKSGVISEVCVSNKQVVEFGQPLFKIAL